MQTLNKWLLAVLFVLAGYYLWSFFVSSRYQALCQLLYWESTSTQLRACDEMKSELETSR